MAARRMCGNPELLRLFRPQRQFHSISLHSHRLHGPHWKQPSGPRLFPAKQSCLCLLGPGPRCLSTSTALLAESQVQTSPILPATPSPTSVTEVVPAGAADVVQAATEQSLSDLGLGGYTPVGLVQNFLEFVHVDLGLPWWGAIVTCTVVARCLIFPLIVRGQRETIKLNNHLPKMQKLSTRMNEAKLSGDRMEFFRVASELQLYQKKHNINPLKGFIVPLAQAPVFLSFFIGLREMSSLPVPSMQNGGLLWFQDLTVADPTYALPLIVTASMWAILELGAETGVNNASLRMMKNFFRVLPLVVLPFTINFPTAVFTYWFSSNLFSLVQVAFLQIPAVRIWLRIPKRIPPEPGQVFLQDGFIKTIKKSPLRQTFAHNPLLQPEGKQPPTNTTTTSSSKPKTQKPWRDTLG
uniref:OXA1L mitochondrial inner membrane protein n=1 Tax=Sarcophilus harrisii TaxID=9305 RepID=G3WFP3_SARHA